MFSHVKPPPKDQEPKVRPCWLFCTDCSVYSYGYKDKNRCWNCRRYKTIIVTGPKMVGQHSHDAARSYTTENFRVPPGYVTERPYDVPGT